MQPEDEAVGEVEHGLGVVGGQLGVAAVAVGAAAPTEPEREGIHRGE